MTAPDQRRRWATTHGVVRGAAARGARNGLAGAELALAPEDHVEPGPAWDRLRTSRPFAPGIAPGVLVTVHHDVAREVLADDAFGMPAPSGGPPGPLSPPSLIALDGPDHARHRARLAGFFTGRSVARWSGRCAALADELLDALPGATGTASDATIDLVAGYAHPLPLRLIAEILGLPAGDEPLPPELPRWADAVVAALDLGLSWERFVAVEAALTELRTWLAHELEAACARGGDGLLPRLAAADDGDPEDLVVTAMFLLAAGFETTTHLVSAGAVVLAAHPEEVARLRADPGRWPAVVEELLRLASPVTRAVRQARRDVEIAGARVPAGTIVEVWTSAADHDPSVFACPHTFDPGRSEIRAHLALGRGPHHCLGAALARMEGAVALRALFDRYPEITPEGRATWRPTRLVQGRATPAGPARDPQRRISTFRIVTSAVAHNVPAVSRTSAAATVTDRPADATRP